MTNTVEKTTYFDDDDDNDFYSLVVEFLSMLCFAGNLQSYF